MCKIWDKIKKLFGGKAVCKPCDKKEESKPQQEEPKAEQKPEEKK